MLNNKTMRKITVSAIILIIGFLTWYLFIKPYDYLVTIKANTIPGTINQTIKLWSKTVDNTTLIDQKDLKNLKQTLKINDSLYSYRWEIIPVNDSFSKIKVYVKDLNNSLKNKITIPFSNTDFEKTTIRTLTDYLHKLDEHTKKYKVRIVGESQIPSTYGAYVSVQSKQTAKAQGMMANYSLLSSVLVDNNVKLNGRPFIEITYWDMEKDSINFNFCYPIIKNDSLPKHELLKYKEFKGQSALKAIYNGNYITSDRAWYALLDYADRMNVNVMPAPVEIFQSNPNFGGNELEWIAEIYMPIIE
jgi:effector-binding domain-containing protein